MAGPNGYDGDPFSSIMDLEEDRRETDKLRKALFEDFTMFLLNNILMSVQFFENYERDIKDFRRTCLDETSLDQDHFKIFDADTLHKLISTKVMYQKRSIAKKETPEILHPLRTYVTYQNVELANNASSLGGKRVNHNPHYRLIVQRCEDDMKEASGYVNIVEPAAFTEEKSEAVVGGSILIHHPDNACYREEDTKKSIPSGVILSKNDTFYVLEPGKRSKPYPLRDYRTNEKISQPAAIPKSCFKEIEKQKFVGNQRRRTGNLGKTAKGKITQKILLSAAFKRHFSEVFATHLAGQLDLDKARLESATFHLDHVVVRKQHAIHHVLPLLEMKEWPYAIATDLFNEEFGKGNGIKWPTKTMEKAIQKLGCSLVPVGYHETTDETSDYTLEWKIDFPKAEKYLIMHMMHTHIRCYLFALLLYKTFIDADDTAAHFGPSHMLNLLFLMARRNFLAWPEYSQGETLTRYLRILEKTLQKKCLKSFFLTNRNLYNSSPQRILHKAQTIINRIIQNPIPYILKALMNLKYKEDFYPELDYLKLYNILTVKDLNKYMNPEPPKKIKGRKKEAQSKAEAPDLGRDTIDEEELVHEKNTPLHREEVLRLFIEHFINVATHCRKYQSYDSSMLYLIHARRLTTLLSEESATRGEIQDFKERIHNGILFYTKSRTKEDDVGTEKSQPMTDLTNRKIHKTVNKYEFNSNAMKKYQGESESDHLETRL